MKRRTLTLMICLLSVLSLVSVGFASWIITANDTQEAEGNIQIETVTDKRVFIKNQAVDGSIIFGAPATMGTVTEGITPWFTTETGTKTEDLTAVITFDVVDSKGDAVDRSKVTIEASVAVKTSEGTTFQALVDAKYIEKAPVVVVDESNFSITVTLNWGELWNKVNPYNFYNAHEVDDIISETQTYGDHAATNIAAFAALNDLEYVVTITAKAK